MKFVGGKAQADYVEQVRGLDPARCLVVAVDVGKRSALALVADHHGQVVADPFESELKASGTKKLLSAVGAAESMATAESVRIGVEAAGHYHRALCWQLEDQGLDVVELNPRSVKLARGQVGSMRLKTDIRDCYAMVELLCRGQGWPFHRHADEIVAQQLWVARRRRNLEAVKRQRNQVHAVADLACPGLIDTFASGLDAPDPSDAAENRWGVGRRNPEVRMSPVNLVPVAVFEADCLKVCLEQEFRVILPRDPLATPLDGQRHDLRARAWRSTGSR